MIVDKAIYRNGRRQGCGDLSDELDVLRLTQDGFLWIGLKDPTDEEFDLVNEELHLHPLAVEDAVNGHQRAKIEKYESSVFVVLKTLRYIEATSDIETGEVMLFIGDRFVVTVRHGEGNPLAGVRQRLETEPERLAPRPDDGAARRDGLRRRQLPRRRPRGAPGPRADRGAGLRLRTPAATPTRSTGSSARCSSSGGPASRSPTP